MGVVTKGQSMKAYYLLAAFLLVGCSGHSSSATSTPGPDATPDSPLLGTWSYVERDVSAIIVFKHDGTFTRRNHGDDYDQTQHGEWEAHPCADTPSDTSCLTLHFEYSDTSHPTYVLKEIRNTKFDEYISEGDLIYTGTFKRISLDESEAAIQAMH